MSSKKKKKEPEIPEEVQLPLMERPRFRLFYSIAVYTIFGAGIILLILSYSIWDGNPYVLFSALGILGVGIILLTMKSSRKHSAPPEEEEKEEDTLQMRARR
ncbi:MAG: hypothetical protein GOP50_07020 [Candidatus Heimdallarchaeota archaeon]|nr:hypothetical protein [Candidatus Heimdallarchaeota archaeon]